MSLKDTINNTNKQKENVKTVATQIDNKLVELGGEQATDLADIPNKMQGMVTENYKKIAIIDVNIPWRILSYSEFEVIIEDLNFNFVPKSFIVIFEVKDCYSGWYYSFLSTSTKFKFNFNLNLEGAYKYTINTTDFEYKESAKTIKMKGTSNSLEGNNGSLYVRKVIAIG